MSQERGPRGGDRGSRSVLVLPTLVHDYNGLAEWMTGRWRMKDLVVRDIIAACRLREMERELSIAFHHQRGHQAVSYIEFARYNAQADALATQVTTSPTEK